MAKEQATAQKVDYSELVDEVLSGDSRKVDQLLKEVIPRLEQYLKVVMGADQETAQECTQQAVLDVYEQIMRGNIREKSYIFSYLMKACRHEFLRYKKKQNRFQYDEESFGQIIEPANQIENLFDKERQQILQECLDELDESSRKLIMHFIKNPDTTTKKASKLFNLSGANVRTRKSRITAELHQRYMEKVAR